MARHVCRDQKTTLKHWFFAAFLLRDDPFLCSLSFVYIAIVSQFLSERKIMEFKRSLASLHRYGKLGHYLSEKPDFLPEHPLLSSDISSLFLYSNAVAVIRTFHMHSDMCKVLLQHLQNGLCICSQLLTLLKNNL